MHGSLSLIYKSSGWYGPPKTVLNYYTNYQHPRRLNTDDCQVSALIAVQKVAHTIPYPHKYEKPMVSAGKNPYIVRSYKLNGGCSKPICIIIIYLKLLVDNSLTSGQETRRSSPMADATSAQLKASLMYSFLDGAEKIRHKNLDWDG